MGSIPSNTKKGKKEEKCFISLTQSRKGRTPRLSPSDQVQSLCAPSSPGHRLPHSLHPQTDPRPSMAAPGPIVMFPLNEKQGQRATLGSHPSLWQQALASFCGSTLGQNLVTCPLPVAKESGKTCLHSGWLRAPAQPLQLGHSARVGVGQSYQFHPYPGLLTSAAKTKVFSALWFGVQLGT